MAGGEDVNGDGVSDLIIGSFGSDSSAGRAYLVFGGGDVGSGGSVILSALDGTTGYIFKGESASSFTGQAIDLIGDINGDGVDDILIGAPWNAGGGSSAGRSYVVFGGSDHLAIYQQTGRGVAMVGVEQRICDRA